jgi:hypothetical protein
VLEGRHVYVQHPDNPRPHCLHAGLETRGGGHEGPSFHWTSAPCSCLSPCPSLPLPGAVSMRASPRWRRWMSPKGHSGGRTVRTGHVGGPLQRHPLQLQSHPGPHPHRGMPLHAHLHPQEGGSSRFHSHLVGPGKEATATLEILEQLLCCLLLPCCEVQKQQQQ